MDGKKQEQMEQVRLSLSSFWIQNCRRDSVCSWQMRYVVGLSHECRILIHTHPIWIEQPLHMGGYQSRVYMTCNKSVNTYH